MVFFGPKSRYTEFRDEFLKETGLTSVEDNLDLYTQYVIARFTDMNNRLLNNLLDEIRELEKHIKRV